MNLYRRVRERGEGYSKRQEKASRLPMDDPKVRTISPAFLIFVYLGEEDPRGEYEESK